MINEHEDTEEVLGITRCARCGHRLDGEVECPFCSIFDDSGARARFPKWVYLTACFLTSPFSIYFIARNSRLTLLEKLFSVSGALLWFGLYWGWSW